MTKITRDRTGMIRLTIFCLKKNRYQIKVIDLDFVFNNILEQKNIFQKKKPAQRAEIFEILKTPKIDIFF